MNIQKFLVLISLIGSMLISSDIQAVNFFTYVTNNGDNSLSVINTPNDGSTPTVTSIPNVGTAPWKLAANSTGTLLYMINNPGNNISIVDATRNSLVTPPITVTQNLKEITLSPDNKLIYLVNSTDDNILIFDIATKAPIAGSPLTAGTSINDILLSPDGKFIVIANGGDGNVSVLDANTKSPLSGSPLNAGTQPFAIAITADSKQIFIANAFSFNVSVIDVDLNSTPPIIKANLKSPIAITPPGFLTNIAINPINQDIYVVNAADGTQAGTLSVIDHNSLTEREVANIGIGPVGIAVSPDGKKIYVANSQGDMLPNAGNGTVSIFEVGADRKLTAKPSVQVGKSPISLVSIAVPPPTLPPGDPNGTPLPPGSNSGGSDKIDTEVTIPANPTNGSGGCSIHQTQPLFFSGSLFYLFILFLPLLFYMISKLKLTNSHHSYKSLLKS